ncbi:MAG: hypothetical protein NC222_06275 [Staphylococcus sp.]|nr:hypothetical protein [Staphylococcus sp.]
MKNLQTLTVKELIKVLSQYDDDTKVAISCDYGDYFHTEQVIPLQFGQEELTSIKETSYSQSGFAVKNDEFVSKQNEEKVLIFRY